MSLPTMADQLRTSMLAVCFFLGTLGVFGRAKIACAGWVVEPVYTRNDARGPVFLDLDPSGRPYASFFENTISSSLIDVRTNSGWQTTQSVFNGLTFSLDNAGNQYYLSYDSNYHPHLGAVGLPSPPSPIESVSFSESAFLGFDSTNSARVAYIDTGGQRLRSATWNGGSWQIQTVATNSSFRYGNSYAATSLDGNNNLHFVFPSGDLFNAPLLYADPTPTGWTISSTGFIGSALDLKIDSAGQANLLFTQGYLSGLHYGKLTATGWSSQLIPGAETFSTYDASLVFDNLGQPHIFARFGNGSEHIAHFFTTAGVWHNETIASWTDIADGPEAISAIIDNHAIHVLFSTGNQQVFYASLAVSEPRTIVLGGIGLLGLMAFARKHRAIRCEVASI